MIIFLLHYNADDSAIWKSGRNLKLITKHLKSRVKKIEDWADKWGFKLNENKTVAMIFSKSPKVAREKIDIKIGSGLIPTVTKIRFLGLTFDQKINWNEHIADIAEKSYRKTNLIRSLSGYKWGANKETLLRLYRTLIRSRMEYGIEVFHTATKFALTKLESIQYKCLRICCGAIKSTPIQALQQECGELPIRQRMEKRLLEYISKVALNKENPANEVLQDSWETIYGKYRPGTEPVLSHVNKYKSKNAEFLENLETPQIVENLQQFIRSSDQWKKRLKKIKMEIEEHIMSLWQIDYDKNLTARHYKTIEPIVNSKIKFSDKHRHKDVTITRLRFGWCRLNHCMFKMKLHPTGQCANCDKQETVEHFLLGCQMTKICDQQLTVKEALSVPANIDNIYKNIIDLNRQI